MRIRGSRYGSRRGNVLSCSAARSSRVERAGFTLLEVVVALAVIALVAVSALAAVSQQLNVAGRARQVVRAEVLATQKLGMLRLLRADELQALPDTIASGTFPPPDNDLSWRVVSQPVMNEYNLNDVRIDIAWQGGSYFLRTRIYASPETEMLQ